MKTRLIAAVVALALASLFAVASVAQAVVPSRSTSAASDGTWANKSVTITTSRLGAVHTGMTVRKASRAAGVRLTALGDGYYGSKRAPGLMLAKGWGPKSCLAAIAPAHVHTPAGIHLGSTLNALRSAYGDQLHWHRGSIGLSDPRSWFIHNSVGYLFFHLSRTRHGHVVRMAAGSTLRDAYC
jgi:hypothetical protein